MMSSTRMTVGGVDGSNNDNNFENNNNGKSRVGV